MNNQIVKQAAGIRGKFEEEGFRVASPPADGRAVEATRAGNSSCRQSSAQRQ